MGTKILLFALALAAVMVWLAPAARRRLAARRRFDRAMARYVRELEGAANARRPPS